ncbi:hypothetical protein D9Q98_001516 [Chlorella vulgaris]|uniref:Uncharacterized protein n=1 Tax=Chlorella vulgaris TaxID=3077 RepID=A0A9D4U0K8_CHLVU|nr:hypothetical protein D9Q98_001516 [Chlorella vulgaris]
MPVKRTRDRLQKQACGRLVRYGAGSSAAAVRSPLEAGAAAAQAAAAEGPRGLGQQCAQELRVMHGRLLSLLATKDGTIAALQCQLQDVQQALAG